MKRESFGSRLGFLLVSAGCAIGIGNVWRFPYITGQNGGGYFVLFYLICLVVMGIPVLTMELAVGRASRQSAVLGYKALEKPGSKWHIHGWFCLIGCYLLMMYYTTVTGWMVNYFGKFLTGGFHAGMTGDEISGMFGTMLGSPGSMVIFTELVVVTGLIVCSFGLQKGLERVTKVMMIALLVIMVVLAVNSLFMPGAKEGLSFFLVPDFGRMKEVGVVNALVSAMNQAFFTLSLGIGAMSIFGSYIGKEHSLLGESARIVVLDTFVAITAGLIIFPACFTYGVDQTSGPSLIFITLPNIFANMALGRLWGTLFFLFMAFAALSTVLAVCENILAMVREMTGWKRPLGCLVCGAGVFILAITTALGYSVFHFQPFAEGTAWLDLWDFLVSNNILPLGSLVFALYCCNKFGWGWDNFVAEANAGKGLKVKAWMKPIFRYLVPVAIIFIYIYGMVTFGWK